MESLELFQILLDLLIETKPKYPFATCSEFFMNAAANRLPVYLALKRITNIRIRDENYLDEMGDAYEILFGKETFVTVKVVRQVFEMYPIPDIKMKTALHNLTLKYFDHQFDVAFSDFQWILTIFIVTRMICVKKANPGDEIDALQSYTNSNNFGKPVIDALSCLKEGILNNPNESYINVLQYVSDKYC